MVFVWFENNTKKYVAYEPVTGVSSQGDTYEEVLRNTKESLELHLMDNTREVKILKEYDMRKPVVAEIDLDI